MNFGAAVDWKAVERRREEIIAQKNAGHTFVEIGRIHGISTSRAQQIYNRERRKWNVWDAERQYHEEGIQCEASPNLAPRYVRVGRNTFLVEKFK